MKTWDANNSDLAQDKGLIPVAKATLHQKKVLLSIWQNKIYYELFAPN